MAQGPRAFAFRRLAHLLKTWPLRGRGFLIGLALILAFSGCHSSSPISSSPAAPAIAASASVKDAPASTSSAPARSGVTPALTHSDFDGAKAFALLEKQCAFGPRVLGTDAHTACRDFLLAEMKKYADAVIPQEFQYRGRTVTNIIGVFYPEGSKAPSPRPVLVLTHWDARPVADGPFSKELHKAPFQYGPKGWNRETPIPAANDGASGTAVVLELARQFKAKHPPVGVLLLLDDGEDYGDFRADNYQGEGVELGSRYFAAHYSEQKVFGQPLYGILLDMVGGKGLNMPREANSQRFAAGINEKVYAMALALGYGKIFRYDAEQSVEDDHMAVNRAGIPTIDLIHPLPDGSGDSNAYRYWHTLEDTPDKCSPQSLRAVGDTIATLLYQETP